MIKIVSSLLSIALATFAGIGSLCPLQSNHGGISFHNSLIAQFEVWNPEELFGSPEEAYDELLEEDLRQLLDEYLGILVAVTGVIFVFRALNS